MALSTWELNQQMADVSPSVSLSNTMKISVKKKVKFISPTCLTTIPLFLNYSSSAGAWSSTSCRLGNAFLMTGTRGVARGSVRTPPGRSLPSGAPGPRALPDVTCRPCFTDGRTEAQELRLVRCMSSGAGPRTGAFPLCQLPVLTEAASASARPEGAREGQGQGEGCEGGEEEEDTGPRPWPGARDP